MINPHGRLRRKLDRCVVQYLPRSRAIEAKEDMKKRGMPSPDEGDAVALCISEPNGSPIPRTSGFNRKIEYPDNAYA